MNLHIVNGAPAPLGCYSHAVTANGFVFASLQGPLDPVDGSIAEQVELQVRQALVNLKSVLVGANSELGKVVKVTAYLAEWVDFSIFDQVYAEVFAGHKPARSTISCKLDEALWIDCIAIAHEAKPRI